MKLIFCPHCHDVFKLNDRPTTCMCGLSAGHYVDHVNAIINESAVPLGFVNQTFRYALHNRPIHGYGKQFKAFVIPYECKTIESIPDNEYKRRYLNKGDE